MGTRWSLLERQKNCKGHQQEASVMNIQWKKGKHKEMEVVLKPACICICNKCLSGIDHVN